MEFLASIGQWIKVLHIASVIAWMAGMMYLPRLFIYHHQAKAGGEAVGLFKVMERRLLKGIMTPSMLATWFFAFLLMVANPSFFSAPWFHIKLLCVIALTGIHGFYAGSYKKFAADQLPRTEKFWRLINEAPFVLMLVILVMVLVKPFI